MSTINFTTKLETINCATCGVMFAIPNDFLERRRADGKQFYCPSGHVNVYYETEVMRLKKKLEQAEREANAAKMREQAERDQRLAAEEDHDKTKRAFARAKKRASAGVCPCCTRSFGNVKKHLATKHPEFAAKFISKTDKLKEKADKKSTLKP